jgi:transcriptional regulator with XRE-family HTH domain
MIETITFERVHLGFAKALKKWRTKKGLSQGDIFKRTGLERTYISRLENGQVDDPRLTTVIILARALDMTVDEFVGEMLKLAEPEERDGAVSKKR